MEISEISHTVNRSATGGISESVSDGLKEAQEDREMAEALERVRCMNSVLRCLYEGTHDDGARILLGRNLKDPQWGREEGNHPVLPEQTDIASILPPGNVIESDVGTCQGQDEVSPFFARKKLRCLTSRNNIRVHQNQKSIWVTRNTIGKRGTNLPERWTTC
jgi:hypothetical protein